MLNRNVKIIYDYYHLPSYHHRLLLNNDDDGSDRGDDRNCQLILDDQLILEYQRRHLRYLRR